MSHIHEVRDSDRHFLIDPITRQIINQQIDKIKLVQLDHNSEIFTFELPRYIEGHDMATCNRVEVHFVNTSSTSREFKDDVYEVNDLQVPKDDLNVVLFTWKISQNATLYAGTLEFSIRLSCITSEIDYAWNTEIFSGIKISRSLNNSAAVVERYSDVLEEWEKRLGIEESHIIVNISPTTEDFTKFSANMDFNSIEEKVDSGIGVYLHCNTLGFTYSFIGKSGGYLLFECPYESGTGRTVLKWGSGIEVIAMFVEYGMSLDNAEGGEF